MVNQRDVECMSHALRLAKRGIYTTRPNPNVGCVITNKQQQIVGEGYHHNAGAPHAEINALSQAGEQARDGTAYVTLEPCCHTGKTGPCTQALIDAGIKKVVIAMRDPNPLVSGKGIEELNNNDIAIVENILTQQASMLNRGFIKRMTSELPWVSVKIASSLDGRIALNNGESKWITSEQSRYDVHRLRARYDAIMTGVGTVLADDPSLNVRINSKELGVDGELMQPLRVVIDPELKLPDSATMLALPGKTLVFTDSQTNTARFTNINNCEVIKLESKQGKFDLHMVLSELAKREINSVLVESGPMLVGKLFDAKLVDELIQYIAPILMGDDAKGMLSIHELTQMSECISLEQHDIRQFGQDIRITSLIKH